MQVRGSNLEWTFAGEERRNELTVLPGILLEAALGGIISAAVHRVVCTQPQKTVCVRSIWVPLRIPRHNPLRYTKSVTKILSNLPHHSSL